MLRPKIELNTKVIRRNVKKPWTIDRTKLKSENIELGGGSIAPDVLDSMISKYGIVETYKKLQKGETK